MADDLPPLDDDRFLLAGEYALGVLEGDERAQAQRLTLSDRAFADAVEWWEWRFARMAEAAHEVEPSADVWRGIQSRIERREPDADVPVTLHSNKPSKGSLIAFAGGAALAVAALVFFVATPTPRPVSAPAPQPSATLPSALFVAQLQDEEAQRRLSGLIDPEGRTLRLDLAGLDAEQGQTAELWVIPEGGTPVSLGYVPGQGRVERGISSEEAQLLEAGATLAVTFEEDTGVRHASPTMPIVLSGLLSEI